MNSIPKCDIKLPGYRKFIEENTDEGVCNHRLGKDFLVMSLKAGCIKNKLIKWMYSKLTTSISKNELL